MNEFLGADPTDVLNPAAPLPVSDRLDEIGYPEEADSDSSLKPRREGLPPGFRMRHDKHYVEELMSTPTVSQRPAYAPGPRPSAAASDPAEDSRSGQPTASAPSAAAVELIAGRLESIVAHSAVSRGRATSDLVGRSVRVELERVARFARAIATSTRQSEPVRRTVSAGEIAGAVRAAGSRIVRLYGLHCVVTTDDPAFTIAIERALVVESIAGTIDALLDLAQASGPDDVLDEGGRLTVALQTAKVRPALIVDVEFAALAWRAAAADRFFDNDEQDFAAAPAAGLLLASAAHVVRLHGGRVEAQLQGGVRIRYVLPQEPPRATAAS